MLAKTLRLLKDMTAQLAAAEDSRRDKNLSCHRQELSLGRTDFKPGSASAELVGEHSKIAGRVDVRMIKAAPEKEEVKVEVRFPVGNKERKELIRGRRAEFNVRFMLEIDETDFMGARKEEAPAGGRQPTPGWLWEWVKAVVIFGAAFSFLAFVVLS